jgi:nuclear control of ATPase protein 2
MTLSLAADVLHYIPEELDSLAQHIQTTGGELTSPVMRVYEEDIRTPIKSAIRGTLIRGILVQVQKAKVCSFLFVWIWLRSVKNFGVHHTAVKLI